MDLEPLRDWYSVEVRDYTVMVRTDAFERKGSTLREGIDVGGLETEVT